MPRVNLSGMNGRRCADTLSPKATSRPARSPISRRIRRTTRRCTPRSISSAASKRTRHTRRTPRRRSSMNEFERTHREVVQARDNVCQAALFAHIHQTLFNVETIRPSGHFSHDCRFRVIHDLGRRSFTAMHVRLAPKATIRSSSRDRSRCANSRQPRRIRSPPGRALDFAEAELLCRS
jgi:hypothetical protein